MSWRPIPFDSEVRSRLVDRHNDINVFEAIHTSRALRRFKPDPIPDQLIAKVLDAAIREPYAGNGQNWLFVVVKDPEQRRKLGEIDVIRSGLRVGRKTRAAQTDWIDLGKGILPGSML